MELGVNISAWYLGGLRVSERERAAKRAENEYFKLFQCSKNIRFISAPLKHPLFFTSFFTLSHVNQSIKDETRREEAIRFVWQVFWAETWELSRCESWMKATPENTRTVALFCLARAVLEDFSCSITLRPTFRRSFRTIHFSFHFHITKI